MTMIVIAGIPGTGKSSTAKLKALAQQFFWKLRKKNSLKLLKTEKLMDYSQESRGFVV